MAPQLQAHVWGWLANVTADLAMVTDAADLAAAIDQVMPRVSGVLDVAQTRVQLRVSIPVGGAGNISYGLVGNIDGHLDVYSPTPTASVDLSWTLAQQNQTSVAAELRIAYPIAAYEPAIEVTHPALPVSLGLDVYSPTPTAVLEVAIASGAGAWQAGLDIAATPAAPSVLALNEPVALGLSFSASLSVDVPVGEVVLDADPG